MEKIQVKNGLRIREINVYVQAKDSENPLFQCWLKFEQDADTYHGDLVSVSGEFYCGDGDSNGNPDGFFTGVCSGHVLSFFRRVFNFKLQKPGDIIQGDRNSYAAAVAEFVIGGLLGDTLAYDGDCTVMRVLK